MRVNLPRWGLKPYRRLFGRSRDKSVNLPRWGLKLNTVRQEVHFKMCKFTPLGFETFGKRKD